MVKSRKQINHRKQKISQQATYWLGIVAVGLILGLSIQFVRAWTEPSMAPPNENVGAPINTGSLPQWKDGNLMINSGWDTNGDGKMDTAWPIGLLVPNGYVGIGTIATDPPTAKLDVRGGVRLGMATQCDTTTGGTLRYNVSKVQYCDGRNWKDLGGKPIYRIYDPSATPGPQKFKVPEGVTYINIQLWGAGGGGGGGLNRPLASPPDSSGISGGGGGGGAYIEAGYNVQGGEIYTITAGKRGAGGDGRYNRTLDAKDGANGADSTFATEDDKVILNAGGGKSGKGGTQSLYNNLGGEGGADAGVGGVASTATGDSSLNLIGMIRGEKGAKWVYGKESANGGSSPKAGFGGKWCNFVSGAGMENNGGFPGGGGAGGGTWNFCGISPEAHAGGDGAHGKVVLFW